MNQKSGIPWMLLLNRKTCIVIYFVRVHIFTWQGMYVEVGDNSLESVLSFYYVDQTHVIRLGGRFGAFIH